MADAPQPHRESPRSGNRVEFNHIGDYNLECEMPCVEVSAVCEIVRDVPLLWCEIEYEVSEIACRVSRRVRACSARAGALARIGVALAAIVL